ncbi:zinc-dependent metalloprotease [Paraflavisolibacter sp. H34]|uniref:zinc-dependent metalloprotease n=1 Tax=Huijunlia imazamoxiresistens TaxID=3127457 RepID=UPI0030183CE4
MIKKIVPFFLLPVSLSPVLAQQAKAPAEAKAQATSITAATAGMQHLPGFIPMYWDAKKGRLFLEIDKLDTEILYFASLSAGVGSNDIGLDRGKMGPSHVVKFQRSGNKVLMTEQNYDYRATTDNEMEKRAVEESFAHSVLAGFEVAADEPGRVLVDATAFFLQQDAVGAAAAISRAKQGVYRIDPQRCAFYLPYTKNFPLNTEVEVTTTLTGEGAGTYLREVVPTPGAVTLRQHFSFVQLPDNQYKPRAFDPRAGIGSISYFDYATPVSEPIEKRFVRRHRLEKKDPNAAVSEAVKPIVYYVDPGTPEPIRSALVEGTAWWNEAFEAAGFKNAFQVKLLPPDADPMDIRYNLVQWVHRSTRGWSYGGGITDPRTGEIIKGKVTLGSLRVRQDFLIAQGLLADFEDGKPLSPQIVEMCMQRMRQLAAHEVGHTLGLPHNYIASTTDRASVMDYPHPQAKLGKNNQVDLSDAYAKGIGDWDKVAVTLAYRQFPQKTDEKKELEGLVQAYMKKGLRFLTDQDARPTSSAHPNTHLWDNGKNAVDELNEVMKVRSVVLNGFSEKKIPTGAPLATLEEVLVPMYFFHRYQVEAAAKVLGGVDYTYALRGDGQKPNLLVPAKEQYRALDALMAAVQPEALALPSKVVDLIPPRPFGYNKNERETFKGFTGMTFDPLSPADAAAGMTFGLILDPQRAARILGHHALHPEQPSLNDLIDRMVAATWKKGEKDGYAGEISRAVNIRLLQQLVSLSANKDAAPQVRAIAGQKVKELEQWLSATTAKGKDWQAHYAFAVAQIKNFEMNPAEPLPGTPVSMPDGAPIGMMCE